MRKVVCCMLILLTITLITGCDSESNDPYGLYKYTEWDSTDGYMIQIYDDDCIVGANGEAFDQVCEFDSNANDTGVAKITICDKYGYDCESVEMHYYHSGLENESIYIYGRSFYYTGKVKRDD